MTTRIGFRCISSQIKSLTFRLSHLTIRQQSTSFASSSLLTRICHPSLDLTTSPTTTLLSLPPNHADLLKQPQEVQQRGFATLRKKKKKQKLTKKKIHELKMKAKQDQSSQDVDVSRAKDEASVASHHRAWVEFQKSISVEGFETGQMTEVVAGHTRNRHRRAMKVAQKKIQARILKRKEEQSSVKSGEYQPLAYSPEETARLLLQAKRAVPMRDGSRRTRQLKRHRRRSFLVRQIRRKYKKNLVRYHHRNMRERSERARRVREILQAAPKIREANRDYQLALFKRWTVRTRNDDIVETKEEKDGTKASVHE